MMKMPEQEYTTGFRRLAVKRFKEVGSVDAMLQNGNGQRLSYATLRTRFDNARKMAGVEFQFQDIRAKTATDTDDLARSQQLPRHKTRAMTE